MKLFNRYKFCLQTLVFVALVGAVVAFPNAPILTRSEIRDDFGQFALSYSTANGISVAQQGALKPVQTEHGLDNVLVQQGAYAYYGADGKLYTVRYIADENGFQPIADHIPTTPVPPVVPVVVV